MEFESVLKIWLVMEKKEVLEEHQSFQTLLAVVLFIEKQMYITNNNQ